MNRVFARGVLTLLMVGMLVLSMTVTASATAPQLWYLDGALHPEVPENGIMQKTWGAQIGMVEIAGGSSQIWLAENAAKCNVAFAGGSWIVELNVDADEGWEATIGGWDVDAQDPWYDIPTATIMTWYDGSNVLIIKFQADPATILKDDYLALKVTNLDSAPHSINTDGRSSLRSPDTDPGYPLPELASVILLGTGLVGLLGYLRLKRGKASTSV